MTDTTQRVVEALESIATICAEQDGYAANNSFQIIREHCRTAIQRLTPTPPNPSTDEIEGIRARHEVNTSAYDRIESGPCDSAQAAHLLRITHQTLHDANAAINYCDELLRLLDASRAELREITEAAGPFLTASEQITSDVPDWRHVWPIGGITASDCRRLAAAVKGEKT